MNETTPEQDAIRRAQAVLAVTVLMLFLGTIIVTVGVSVIFGLAWGAIVLGALMVVFGLILGFSV